MMTARQLFERYAPDSDDPAKMLANIVQEAHVVIRLTAITWNKSRTALWRLF